MRPSRPPSHSHSSHRRNRSCRSPADGRRRRPALCRAEPLENRLLFAADTLTITPTNALSFVGSADNNIVTVSFSGGVYSINDLIDPITVANGGTGVVTGDGTNTVTVTNVTSLSFDTGGGSDTFNITSINDPTTIDNTFTGPGPEQAIYVGSGPEIPGDPGIVEGIRSALTLHNALSVTDLTLIDGNDNSPRDVTVTAKEVTGLAPAAIRFDGNSLHSLSLECGLAGNNVTVDGTPINLSPGIALPTTVHTGLGTDTVHVLATNGTNGATLNIDGQGGEDAVTVSDGGSVQKILGPVYVGNTAALTVDDSADTTARNVVVNNKGITGLSPAPVHFVAGRVGSVQVTAGTGADSFSVTPVAGTTLSLDGNLPAPADAPDSPGDALDLSLTGLTGATNCDALGPYGNAGTWSFSNAGTVSYSDFETLTPAPLSVRDVAGVTPTLAQVQLSQVRALIVTLPAPGTLTANQLSLSLLNTGGSGKNDNSTPTPLTGILGTPVNSSNDGKTWLLPYIHNTASTDASGAIADGIYSLTVSLPNNTPYSLLFHRLFGDTDGNRTVNAADYARFKAAFGTTTGSAAYNADLDFDNNGTVNALDYAQFKKRFGMTFSY